MARRNARANGLQGRVRIARSPPRPAGGPASFEEGQTAFDLVVANITAAVLTKLMPHLAAAAKPGGLLLLSGVLKEQMSELAEHALGHGLRLTETREEGDWTATVWRQG